MTTILEVVLSSEWKLDGDFDKKMALIGPFLSDEKFRERFERFYVSDSDGILPKNDPDRIFTLFIICMKFNHANKFYPYISHDTLIWAINREFYIKAVHQLVKRVIACEDENEAKRMLMDVPSINFIIEHLFSYVIPLDLQKFSKWCRIYFSIDKDGEMIKSCTLWELFAYKENLMYYLLNHAKLTASDIAFLMQYLVIELKNERTRILELYLILLGRFSLSIGEIMIEYGKIYHFNTFMMELIISPDVDDCKRVRSQLCPPALRWYNEYFREDV